MKIVLEENNVEMAEGGLFGTVFQSIFNKKLKNCKNVTILGNAKNSK